MRTFPSTRSTRFTAPLLAATALLLGACAADDATAPVAGGVRAAVVTGAPLLRWAPAVNAPASYGFAVAPDGRLYAAADLDGVLVAERGTLSWGRAGALPADVIAASIAAAPDGAIYVGTSQGVFRSDDGGTTWTPTALAEGYIRQVVVDGRGSIYAGQQGMGGGVLRSDDSGASWRMVHGPFMGRGGIIDWMSVRKDDVLLGLYSQVPMYSRDRGESWEYLGSLFELPEWNAIANDMIETSNGALLATWVRGIARSVDGGQRFEHVYAGGSVQQLTIDAATGALFAMRDDGAVLRSTDDGITWTAFTGPFRPRGVEAFAVAPDGGLVLGTWQGIWRTVP
jgi:photosystem II stability/assembly factor-like uncharacterized protein